MSRAGALPRLSGMKADILVLGGGYAGVLAANRVAGRLGRAARVTLISDRDDLVHRVRLHEVIAGRRWRRYPLASLVRRRVTLVRARVARVDAAVRAVVLDDGRRLTYDHLIHALGSRVALGAPGADAHAGGLRSLEAALAARERLAALGAGSPVVVVGGGLTAIEAATEIAEARPELRVTLVAGTLAAGLSEPARDYVRATLATLGVEVREGEHASAVEEGAVIAGARLPSAFTIWAGGFTAGAAIDGDLPVDARGRVITDATLAVPGAAGVWACGDGAAPPPGLEFVRMSCASAMPMAAHAADNVARAVRGRATLPWRFGFLVQCISLGRRRGVVQGVDARDAPTGRVYTGRTGALIKEAICRFVIGSMRVERRWAGSYWWPRAVPALGPGEAPRALPAAEH
jgi:NADH dehydrogenase FAD-containing subunit